MPGLLTQHSTNPRYFDDGSGRAILLTGSHFWYTQTDAGVDNPPAAFDFTEWLDFLEANGHNFMRGWMWEQTRNAPGYAGNFYFSMHPWNRSATSGHADGGNKFDLTSFNQDYFDRLRARIIAAGNRGIYYSVMLFQGWSIYPHAVGTNPWTYHPMKSNNNVNSINGDPDTNNNGIDTQNLSISAITALQEALVEKFIDELNDLDNIIWEIGNELWSESDGFQEHFIDYIKAYEATKDKQHLVWYTPFVNSGNDSLLLNSNADIVSLRIESGYDDDMPANDGDPYIIINDTDHIYGIGGDRSFVWKSFCRGLHPIFMDTYDGTSEYFENGYDLTTPTSFISLRLNMGYCLALAERIDLANMTPQNSLSSTGYCLAKAGEPGEYVAYRSNAGTITVDLSATPGAISVEWINPATGEITQGADIVGGASRILTPPFSGDSIVHLKTVAIPTPFPGFRPSIVN